MTPILQSYSQTGRARLHPPSGIRCDLLNPTQVPHDPCLGYQEPESSRVNLQPSEKPYVRKAKELTKGEGCRYVVDEKWKSYDSGSSISAKKENRVAVKIPIGVLCPPAWYPLLIARISPRNMCLTTIQLPRLTTTAPYWQWHDDWGIKQRALGQNISILAIFVLRQWTWAST